MIRCTCGNAIGSIVGGVAANVLGQSRHMGKGEAFATAAFTL